RRKCSMRASACEASAGSCINAARDSRLESMGSAPPGGRRGVVDFKGVRIDDHAVILGVRLRAHETLHDVKPDKLRVAVQGIAPATSAGGRDNGRGSGGNHMTHDAHRLECGL